MSAGAGASGTLGRDLEAVNIPCENDLKYGSGQERYCRSCHDAEEGGMLRDWDWDWDMPHNCSLLGRWAMASGRWWTRRSKGKGSTYAFRPREAMATVTAGARGHSWKRVTGESES